MTALLSHISGEIHTHPADITIIIIALAAWAFLRYLLAATGKGQR